jgi:hypothetical protein
MGYELWAMGCDVEENNRVGRCEREPTALRRPVLADGPIHDSLDKMAGQMRFSQDK